MLKSVFRGLFILGYVLALLLSNTACTGNQGPILQIVTEPEKPEAGECYLADGECFYTMWIITPDGLMLFRELRRHEELEV